MCAKFQPFDNRYHAGRVIAEKLNAYRDHPEALVLALPRGGVPVAFEVAKVLEAPLDVLVVRKLGMPGHEELALGALSSGGAEFVNEELVKSLGVSQAALDSVRERLTAVLARLPEETNDPSHALLEEHRVQKERKAKLDELQRISALPLLVTSDMENGPGMRLGGIYSLPHLLPQGGGTVFPPLMALGATGSESLARELGRVLGAEARAVGVHLTFGPVLDVNSNPENPIINTRAFGADPELVGRLATAYIEGAREAGLMTAGKHFPGHGDAAVDSHLALPTLDLTVAELERREWIPFVAAFRAGVAAVMTAHIVMSRIDPEYPATLSRTVMTGLLRERLGFDGVVFSDALEMRAIADRWGGPESAVLTLAAGVDMPAQVASMAVQEATIVAIERAVAEERLDQTALAASAERLRRLQVPGRAAHGAAHAWREGDSELLDDAARRGLVALGDIPRVSPGDRLVLVASQATRQSAATQATVSPASGLAAALRERGVDVIEVRYQQDEVAAAHERALASAATADVVVFASTARTVLRDEEVAFARALADAANRRGHGADDNHGPDFVHVALWNPYLVASVPGPALVTFGWRQRSVRAAVDALLGTVRASAPPPVDLRTA